MSAAVEVRELSKTYIIEEDQASTLKEKALRLFAPTERKRVEALRPLSFDVERGETLGIIGQNGAGKSTLLKIVAGVTPPTSGSVKVNGTLMAMLELGAGFELELSGIENIYLNGSFLGLKEAEIDRLLPSIVEFSELQDFLYTPVKHYSSGMTLRLAFSIAAHIEPDVIVIDEHLAVGDLRFQNKCLNKLRELKRRGRTVLLVTHSLDVAESLCDRVLWLREGEMARLDVPNDTVHRYEQFVTHMELRPWSELVRRHNLQIELSGRYGTGEIEARDVRLLNARGELAHEFDEGEPIAVEIRGVSKIATKNLNAIVGVAQDVGYSVFLADLFQDRIRAEVEPGDFVLRLTIDPQRLRAGRYGMNVALCPNDVSNYLYDFHLRLYNFRIRQSQPAQLRSAFHPPFRIGTQADAAVRRL